MQLRWFLAALVALAVSVPPAAMFSDTVLGSVLFELFWALPPIAIGVAVLRHRLYEINRIISRAVAYAAVSALLAGVYLLMTVVPSTVLELDSDLLVAAATLAVAALFIPVRRRVQAPWMGGSTAGPTTRGRRSSTSVRACATTRTWT
jgi:hypothetical protein